MSFRSLIATCLLALLLVPAAGRASDVQASLSRTQVQLGDTVTLNLEIKGSHGQITMPDLSALGGDFQVLGTSQNSSMSVVNGAVSSALTIGIALRPQRVGQLQIPSLTVAGTQTAPLQLTVTATSPADASDAGRDVYVQVQVEPDHGYVGQQLSYVVKLYYAGNLSGGSLDQPQAKDAQIDSLGSALRYSAQRGGRTYQVIERRYAVIPQRAGDIVLPALGFQGEEVDPNDPNSFFGAATPVSATAPAQTIHVTPPPSSWGKSAWLPARSLSLTLDGLPDAGTQVRVGQALNLTMNLQATGLPSNSLPSLSLPTLDGATVYPDKPVTGDSADGLWTVGRRQQAFAVVPERAGPLTIPATTLKWWNVQTDQAEVATIPARTLTVLPAVGAPTAAPPAATSSAALPALTSAATPVTRARAKFPHPWRWIALGSLGVWLLSVLVWLLWRGLRRRRSTQVARPDRADPTLSARQCRLAFLAAARGADPAAQLHTLLAWARSERAGIHNPGQLAQALADPEQRAVIGELQQSRYRESGSAVESDRLARAFASGFVWSDANPAGGKDDELAPLYPFKLQ